MSVCAIFYCYIAHCPCIACMPEKVLFESHVTWLKVPLNVANIFCRSVCNWDQKFNQVQFKQSKLILRPGQGNLWTAKINGSRMCSCNLTFESSKIKWSSTLCQSKILIPVVNTFTDRHTSTPCGNVAVKCYLYSCLLFL